MKKKIQIVIPMAGYGSRLRPLTWSKPKPLINLAGRTSLDYLLDEFTSLENEFDPEYIFIISPNGLYRLATAPIFKASVIIKPL